MEPLKIIELGKSRLKVSELGVGGIPIMRVTKDEAKHILERAIELGIRFFDSAHVYGDSEEKIGEALEPFKKEVVIATKVWARDAKRAAEQLAMSFDRLRTNVIDLIQCHNISNQVDLDKVMSPGGAYEVLEKAKAQRKVKAIGFSSHNPEIAAQACRLGKFDTLQFPFNFIENDPLNNVFPTAFKYDMGLIGMKPLGGGLLDRADLCFRFLQSHPHVIPIPGIQSISEIEEIVSLYRNRMPFSRQDMAEIEVIRNELGKNFCHRCEYCMPCEQGVLIPHVLMVKSQVKRFSPTQLLKTAKKAIATVDNCIECGECTEKCPYDLPVPDMLRESRDIYIKFLSEHGLSS